MWPSRFSSPFRSRREDSYRDDGAGGDLSRYTRSLRPFGSRIATDRGTQLDPFPDMWARGAAFEEYGRSGSHGGRGSRSSHGGSGSRGSRSSHGGSGRREDYSSRGSRSGQGGPDGQNGSSDCGFDVYRAAFPDVPPNCRHQMLCIHGDCFTCGRIGAGPPIPGATSTPNPLVGPGGFGGPEGSTDCGFDAYRAKFPWVPSSCNHWMRCTHGDCLLCGRKNAGPPVDGGIFKSEHIGYPAAFLAGPEFWGKDIGTRDPPRCHGYICEHGICSFRPGKRNYGLGPYGDPNPTGGRSAWNSDR